MPSPVEVLFEVKSFEEVQKAIGSVQDSLDRLARAGQGAADRASKSRIKSEQDVSKATDKSAKDATKAIDREERERIRIKNAVNALEVRDWNAKEKEKTRASDRESRDRVAAEKRALSEQESAYSRSLRSMESNARSFGRTVGSSTSRAMGHAARFAGMAIAIGGGFSVADSVKEGVAQEAKAGVIFRGASTKGDFQNQKEVEQFAQATAISTGAKKDDILSGFDQFVRTTGDLGATKTLAPELAKLSAATGANFGDMGNTAAQVFNQVKDSDKTMEVMRAFAGYGRAGAIDIKDLSQYGGRLAASAAQYGGSLTGNIESFAAVAQLSKKLGGSTDTAEATEAVSRLGSDVKKKSDTFDYYKVDVFADKGKTKLRNIEDIITDSVSKTGGDLTKLSEMFGERSIRAVMGAQVAYANAGGGAKGEAAIRGQFRDLKINALSQDQIDEDVKSRLAENDAQLNIAMEQLHKTVNERLLPQLPGLIQKFSELIPTIGSFIDFLTSLAPWQGIGLIVGGLIGAEIAKAGLSKGIEAAIVALINRLHGGGGGGGGGGGDPVPDPVPNTKVPRGAGMLTQMAKMLPAAELVSDASEKVSAQISGAYDKNVSGNINAAGQAADLIASGKATPEQREDAQQKLRSMQSMIVGARGSKEEDASFGGSVIGDVKRLGTDLFGSGGSADRHEQDKAAARSMEQLTAVADKLAKALGSIEVTASNMGEKGPADPNHPSRGPIAP